MSDSSPGDVGPASVPVATNAQSPTSLGLSTAIAVGAVVVIALVAGLLLGL